MLQSRCWKEKACWLVRIFIESFNVYKKFWRLNFQESYHFEDCLHFSIFKTFETSKHSIAINIEWIECIISSSTIDSSDLTMFTSKRWMIYQKKKLKVWMVLLKFVIDGRYCSLVYRLQRNSVFYLLDFTERSEYYYHDSISTRSEFQSDGWWKVPMLVGYIRKKRYYFMRRMCFLSTYSPTFCLCTTTLHYYYMLWQNKNEHSSSNLLHVCCFGFHPQQNQKRTSHILFSTISRNCYELMIRDRREIYSHGLWGGAFEIV